MELMAGSSIKPCAAYPSSMHACATTAPMVRSVTLARRCDRCKEQTAIEEDLVAADLAGRVELDEAHTHHIEGPAADGNRGVPLVEEPVFERDAFQLRPDPVRV